MKVNTLSLEKFGTEILKGWDIRLSPRFWSYRPQYEVYLETPQYILKTAKTIDELIDLFELRHQIFLGDEGFDLDQFDDQCDHILIIDKASEQICGTYRIMTSLSNHNFYSETEFLLGEFLETSGVKMELGRACITPEHRNGSVIDLLWRGIGQYAQFCQADYLFGCSSVKGTDVFKVKALYDDLKTQNLISDHFQIRSYGDFRVDFSEMTPLTTTKLEDHEYKKLLPPLLRSYFNAGAKVYGTPALDLEFECFDFLTILKLTDLSPSFKRRYFN